MYFDRETVIWNFSQCIRFYLKFTFNLPGKKNMSLNMSHIGSKFSYWWFLQKKTSQDFLRQNYYFSSSRKENYFSYTPKKCYFSFSSEENAISFLLAFEKSFVCKGHRNIPLIIRFLFHKWYNRCCQIIFVCQWSFFSFYKWTFNTVNWNSKMWNLFYSFFSFCQHSNLFVALI